MPASDILIRGAREHNLRDVDVTLPRNQLICLTGVSGSGKSSLAFDTLFAEGQRRYVESLSTFARQFLGQMPKPDVDLISGLSPSISISQKSSGNNPRSTVGTITEIYDFLRVIFARIGEGHCPSCGERITAQSREQIIGQILSLPKGSKFAVLAPVVRQQKGEHRDLLEDLQKQGYVRARVDGRMVRLDESQTLDRQVRHDIEAVVDRLTAGPSIRGRLGEAVDAALKLGDGALIVAPEEDDEADDTAEAPAESKPSAKKPAKKRRTGLQAGDIALSADFACNACGLSFEPPSPQLFSFNSPRGMCLTCDGIGEFYSFDPERLVEHPTKSFAQGCFALVDKWKDLGRWKRHIFQGVADTMERKLGLEEGTLLETPWQDLSEEHQNIWLWGTGEEHITYTWRAGKSSQKYGGEFEGVIPELLEKYRSTQSQMQIRQLEKFMRVIDCPDCEGQRINDRARGVKITTANPAFAGAPTKSLPELCELSISEAGDYFADLVLSKPQRTIAEEAIKEVRGRLGFLAGVGLEYLSLNRTAPTLSGGETQRIRLAGQVGCGLVGVLYILDEPSIGLHPRDNDRLIETLTRLRDLGNTVVVVEHDEDTMRAADLLIDFGPGPGVKGGEVVAVGTADEIAKKRKSVTGAYLGGKRKIEVPKTRRLQDPPSPAGEGSAGFPTLTVVGARQNNLKDVTVEIPLGAFVCVTGVSGSGKSSLVNSILREALLRDLMKGKGKPGDHDRIEGVDQLDKIIAIDQSPIGRTPRSNPGTYIKVFDDIRNLYAQLPESKRRGYKPGRFSFNVAGGRCEACEGNGANKLEMDFLADVWVTCQVCAGKRFNRETLQVEYKGVSIADALEMDICQALEHFEAIPSINHKLSTLHAVGLDYLKIGQPSPTLSGGEAQRIKLAKELVKKSTGKTLYLLDEPTTGLHFADIEMLLNVLHNFADAGNTVLVVEHNLDVIKTADWLIDIGPEGGAGGGQVVFSGTPEALVEHTRDNPALRSYTGEALGPVLDGTMADKPTAKAPKRAAPQATHIEVRGARQHNLRGVDAKFPRDEMTVLCGPSGSGKSSLAMDTIYAEGQRRYVESLSSYARQFVGQMQKPLLDHIEGLSPAVAIEQRSMGHSPRSTVGTVTEIYDYFRVLFARLGAPYCPECETPIGTQTSDQVVDKVMAEPEGTKLQLMAPVEPAPNDSYAELWTQLRKAGFRRVRVDGQTHDLEDPPRIDRRQRHEAAVVVDRIVVKPSYRGRIAEAVESALSIGHGVMLVSYPEDERAEPRWRTRRHSQHLACDGCGRSFESLTPHNFSFNSELGWCPSCEGLGTQTGANPASMLRDDELTLAQGAVLLWPHLSNDLSKAMLAALAEHTGLPTDTPYNRLSARHRRVLLYGTGDEWVTLDEAASNEALGVSKSKKGKAGSSTSAPLKFQFKGLYPALEEASRLSPKLRSHLEHLVDEIDCSECGSSRLRDDASAVRFRSQTIDQIVNLPLGELLPTVQGWKLDKREKKIAGEIVREISSRVTFLVDVGLEYLTLGRTAPSLSGGESQRIRLASQVGSGLVGVLYVLDEPTIGLHPRDNTRLIEALQKLRDLGNTLLVVEHDKEVVASADRLIDFGPGAGVNGGQIVADGTPEQVSKKRKSVTGPYLSGKKAIMVPSNRRITAPEGGRENDEFLMTSDSDLETVEDYASFVLRRSLAQTLRVEGARHNNLKNIDIDFPLGVLTAVTGVSGSGKSSLVNEILFNQLARTLHRAGAVAGKHDRIRGLSHINKVIRVDQTPLGNSPSSNPATYTGAFDLIRQLFAQLPEAKLRGYTARQFSFNVAGGRCDACEGAGQTCVEMHFLPDVWIECEVCQGQRYNPDTLSVRYREKTIADVLAMPCAEALKLFSNIPKIRRVLKTLCDVGLDYVTLGQSAPTLSGGEAQRVKLASELARPDTGRTLYLLDEPTTGLHFDDLAKLLGVLHRLVDMGNTVVVIEHNLDVIKQCDWVIDIGPEAGKHGGEVVVEGTPEMLVEEMQAAGAGRASKKGKKKSKDAAAGVSANGKPNPAAASHTALALAPILAEGPYEERPLYDPAADDPDQQGDLDLDEVGEGVKMPWEEDGRRWHCQDRVARDGSSCLWEGKLLDRVERKIQSLGDFAPTNWNNRSIVEITGQKKSDGWFFHALTGERALVKLKFRTAKKTFQRDQLVMDLALKSLNDLDDVEAYGSGPRVQCKNLRGPWQEVQIAALTMRELDKPAFWEFVEKAVEGFQRFATRVEQNPEDLMPWKVLGQKWHLARKGFAPGKKVVWSTELLEELLEMVAESSPKGEFLWNNKVLVHRMVPGRTEPWATLVTKRPENVELALNGPKGAFQLGQITELGVEQELNVDREDRDTVRLKFVEQDDLARGDLAGFVAEHLEACLAAGSSA
ncbi:UvrABC system protein A [Pseudobythopirellula maris]|uniref:UvrABC system protein A n=1 Tax=Pseudobythopirellula maris TaxID=2527991 RepID=A0A5C5ZM14_9BACT|nr:excinuclease ABC subunit UvrA [Pseudobythopirellula maris]TWT88439.1 UvrABC system protein A [Pseudobythopirellula maris]